MERERHGTNRKGGEPFQLNWSSVSTGAQGNTQNLCIRLKHSIQGEGISQSSLRQYTDPWKFMRNKLFACFICSRSAARYVDLSWAILEAVRLRPDLRLNTTVNLTLFIGCLPPENDCWLGYLQIANIGLYIIVIQQCIYKVILPLFFVFFAFMIPHANALVTLFSSDEAVPEEFQSQRWSFAKLFTMSQGGVEFDDFSMAQDSVSTYLASPQMVRNLRICLCQGCHQVRACYIWFSQLHIILPEEMFWKQNIKFINILNAEHWSIGRRRHPIRVEIPGNLRLASTRCHCLVRRHGKLGTIERALHQS